MSQQSQSKPLEISYSAEELYDGDLPIYCGESLSQISFPLGGIGTGTIGLGGRGELRDWEIHNRPDLGHRPPYTMPYIFCKQGQAKIARVLERELLPPFHSPMGLDPKQFAGLPRLREAAFVGTYPMARIFFRDENLPVSVQLEAFNPMIPHNPADSAIPAAILVYRLTNRTRKAVSGSVAISMANEVGRSSCGGKAIGGVNAFRKAPNVRGIHMTSAKFSPGQVGYGTQALATLGTSVKNVSYATDFDEPGWFDRGQKVWNEYSITGKISGPKKRADTVRGAKGMDNLARELVAMVTAGYNLAPGESTEIVFVLAWSFPVRETKWGWVPPKNPQKIQNHYASKFPDAWKAVRYVADNFGRLRAETLRFERTLFDSTLPGAVLDAASSQMSTIRTNTTMWLNSPTAERNGRIFAFEGCGPDSGCCPMNCTHVWNYAQSMAHLYPSLERTMRTTDFTNNQRPSGEIVFRTKLPVGSGFDKRVHLPAADGQFGTVVRMHREWRISGDDKFLAAHWPQIKKAIQFAWKRPNGWDAGRTGVLDGPQHNTYDIEFHGANTLAGTMYLAALQAGAEMARAVGDTKTVEQFEEVFHRGRKRYAKLFNGEYYIQQVRKVAKGKKVLDIFDRVVPAGRPKYQQGHGCLSDQLVGQWSAHVAGLGYVLPREQVRSALAAIFEHNFRADLSDHECCQRVYAVGDEAGLVLCSWPRGKREKFPFPYSDEVWTGIEYQVAAHMIYEGMVDEGLAIVKAVRDRHDGVCRNPWNEFECGDHYARAMSSWSLLLALSGQRYDGRNSTLTFRPAISADDFRCMYTAADGYGMAAQQYAKNNLKVRVDCQGGRVDLKAIELAWPRKRVPARLALRARLNGKPIPADLQIDGGALKVELARKIRCQADDALSLSISPAGGARKR